MGDTCKRAVPWVGAWVAWINGSNAVRTPVSDPLERARVHAYAKRQWRDRRTGTSRPLGPWVLQYLVRFGETLEATVKCHLATLLVG